MHVEFWQPMDTLRDKQNLETLWKENRTLWKHWQQIIYNCFNLYIFSRDMKRLETHYSKGNPPWFNEN